MSVPPKSANEDRGMPFNRPAGKRWLEAASFYAAILVVIYFKPFSRLLGFTGFEQRHGAWLEVAVLCGAWTVVKAVYLYGFRRSEQRAQFAAVEDDIRRGRIKRMPLAARSALLVAMLGLVILGWYAREPYGRQILAASVPLFLLFAAIELSCVLRPGEAIVPDPRDELLLFFRSRMLAVGYVTAILALIALYLTSLLAAPYVGVLLPVLLTVTLLAPAFVYRRLDRQAGAGD